MVRKDSLELLKQKEIFDELINERKFVTNKLSEGIDFNNLIYRCKGESAPKKNGRISLEKEQKIKEEFQLDLNEILKRNLDYKSEDQISAIKNIK